MPSARRRYDSAALSLIAAAATPEPVKPAKAFVATAPDAQPAKQCLTDLSALQSQMRKDGYWRGTSAYDYGYPMYGYEYDRGMGSSDVGSDYASGDAAYWHARPGYEVHTLLAAAQILAQRGRQASCEAMLGETREIYSRYVGEMRSGHSPRNDASNRQAQLATAQPVAGQNISYRSDQLIGTEVLNLKGDEIGSVDDLVLSPQTGKIAYLVIARGGLFGFDQNDETQPEKPAPAEIPVVPIGVLHITPLHRATD